MKGFFFFYSDICYRDKRKYLDSWFIVFTKGSDVFEGPGMIFFTQGDPKLLAWIPNIDLCDEWFAEKSLIQL